MNARTRPGISVLPALTGTAVVAASLLTGCADESSTPSAGPSIAPSSATSPSSIPSSDSLAAEPPSLYGSLVGRYTFQIGSDHFVARLGADGSARIYVEGELDAAGTFDVYGTEVAVLDEESGVGDFCSGPGRYRWSLTGEHLSMTLISEDCPGRTELWTAGWTRVSGQP